MIESVESSNRIEGVVVPEGRLKEVLGDRGKPKNWAEGEVCGYKDVLVTLLVKAYEELGNLY